MMNGTGAEIVGEQTEGIGKKSIFSDWFREFIF
jgi:hypothetical protein